MFSSRIPTVITDINGKTTTVHKRAAPVSKSASSLTGIKPTVAPSQKRKPAVNPNKKVMVEWQSLAWGNKAVDTGTESFLHRAGLAEQVKRIHQKTRSGKQDIELWELYEFLRNGISPSEGAMLHVLGIGADRLSTDPSFRNALPGNLSRIVKKGRNETVSVTSVVDLMQEHGVNPKKAAAILANGLNDEHYENTVLEPKELLDLFDRFKYQHSVNAEKSTVSSNTLDAVMDGRLPFGMVDKANGIDRPTASMALNLLYPESDKHAGVLSDAHRQELLRNPDLVVQVAAVMSKRRIKNNDAFSQTADAIKTYGYENCMEFDPGLMNATLSDGSVVGPDGARQVDEFLNYFNTSGNVRIRNNYRNKGVTGELVSPPAYKGIVINYADLVELRRAGASNEDMNDLFERGLDPQQAMAVVNKETITAVAEGWL